MDVKQILTNMAMLGIFVFGIMMFIITTQVDNSVTNPITNDSRIDQAYSDLNDTFYTAESTSKNASDNFGQITPTQQYGELEVTSVVSPTKVAKSIILGFWNIFVKLPVEVLGISPIVTGLIGSLLLIFVIIGIWAIWKGVIQ